MISPLLFRKPIPSEVMRAWNLLAATGVAGDQGDAIDVGRLAEAIGRRALERYTADPLNVPAELRALCLDAGAHLPRLPSAGGGGGAPAEIDALPPGSPAKGAAGAEGGNPPPLSPKPGGAAKCGRSGCNRTYSMHGRGLAPDCPAFVLKRGPGVEQIGGETPLQIGWRTWRAAYRGRWGGAYATSAGCGRAMSAAVVCAQDLLVQLGRPAEDLEVLLAHRWDRYLKDPGRPSSPGAPGFLLEKKHALRYLDAGLVGYGTPWDPPRGQTSSARTPEAAPPKLAGGKSYHGGPSVTHQKGDGWAPPGLPEGCR